jgi:NAD(P)-dependent dehydrogenase (short-subunit alcohol dehydrogenase family)
MERKTDMDINGSVVLVTGGNRGLGKAFVQALLMAGARKVYVGTRDLARGEASDPRLQLIKLDITDAHDVTAAALACQDVNILINNAGISHFGSFLEAPSIEGACADMETNYLGTLTMCRAFAPILKSNGGGILVNILSVASWCTEPFLSFYCASKAAEWSLTNGIRVELRAQGTLVVGVYAGFIDTNATSGIDVPKSRPEDIVAKTLAAIVAGQEEVLADKPSQDIRALLATTDPQTFYQQASAIVHGIA